MIDQLERIEKRYEEIDRQMAMPEMASDLKQLQALAQERAGIENRVIKYREYKTTLRSLEETRIMLGDGLDEDMTALAKQEIEALKAQSQMLAQQLSELQRRIEELEKKEG